MIEFIDGNVAIMPVNRLIDLYYHAYCDEFAAVSRAQFDGSQEYEIAYLCAERDHQNGIFAADALTRALESVALINEAIARPACLTSRALDALAPLGFAASLRPVTLETAGRLAICIDTRAIEAEHDGALPRDTARAIGETIKTQILPAGVWLDGDRHYETAIGNGQPLKISWYNARDVALECRLTLTRSRNSNAPVLPVNDVIALFRANLAARWRLGCDFAPAAYLQLADLPFCAEIALEYRLGDGAPWRADVLAADFRDAFVVELPPASVVYQ